MGFLVELIADRYIIIPDSLAAVFFPKYQVIPYTASLQRAGSNTSYGQPVPPIPLQLQESIA